MGLFSRRKKSDPPAETGIPVAGEPTPTAEPVPDAEAARPESAPAEDARSEESAPADDTRPAASVGISVSSFQGLGVPGSPDGPPAASAPQARPRVPAEAPPPSETVPGLRDNVLLRQALAGLSATPTAPELLNVARQLLQGHVFLRVQGDARELLAEGKPLPLSIAQRGETQYVLAYSGGAALQDALRADGDTGTSAAGQPVLAVIRHVLASTTGGIILDSASQPARAVLPRPILERALAQADEQLRVKTLLAGPRTDATAAEIAAALSEVPIWVAVRSSENGPVGVAESRTPEGERYLEIFSHPLEALALGRGDNAAPLTAVQLATALSKDPGVSGVLVDPAGPWIRLTRADLAPLLALAD